MVSKAITSLNFRYLFSSGGDSWFCGKYGGGLFILKAPKPQIASSKGGTKTLSDSSFEPTNVSNQTQSHLEMRSIHLV